MDNINLLLDRVKAASSLPSDYAIAKKLSVSPNRIYDYRKGRRLPGQPMVMELAEMAKEPPSYWLATIESDRTTDDKLSRYWSRAAQSFSM